MTLRKRSRVSRSIRASLSLGAALALTVPAMAGTWTPLTNLVTGNHGVMLLLLMPDGTVMAAGNDGSTIGNTWYRLTPDNTGSYINGTWSPLASSPHTRLYYPAEVMRNGKVIVAGGEYGSGGPFAEIYDPQANSWADATPTSPLWSTGTDNFYDCNSETLPDGRVLIMPVFPHTSGTPLIYDPASGTWANAGHLFRGSYQDEASWVKLPDDSILTIDPFGTQTERYIPSTNTWVNDGVVPISLYDPFGFELGGAVYLPNGKAFFLGSTGHTALYSPTGTTSPGTWVAGPDIPGARGTPDAPCAMMVNGKVLCAVSPVPTSGNHFPSPTSFVEYDPTVGATGAFANAPSPVANNDASFISDMLTLPTGQVLYSRWNAQLYVYTPDGSPLPQGKPTITSVTANGDGSYHLVGTGLNGISEGASYGDDLQMNSNYPLVRFTDSLGHVSYGRTYNWSTTSIATGATPMSVEFVPPTLPPGGYSFVVVGNGFASDPTTIGPVVVPYCFGDGTDQFCPCFNNGVTGHGCDNSAATGGTLLSLSGTASLTSDSVVFTANGELPTALSVLVQGDATIFPANYGDGLRCVSGSLKRLYTKSAVGGVVIAPQGGDPSVSSRSAALGDTIASGSTRYYQIYHRDPNPSFCPMPLGSTFNISNGISVTWGN
jgi:hypothetical protein